MTVLRVPFYFARLVDKTAAAYFASPYITLGAIGAWTRGMR